MNALAQNSIPFIQLGLLLQQEETFQQYLEPAIARQYQLNTWFTPSFCRLALQNVIQMLEADALKSEFHPYDSTHFPQDKTIAIIPQKEIPLQCFPDFLHILASGNRIQCKLDPNEDLLLHTITQLLSQIEPSWRERIAFVSKISDFDVVIADVEAEKTAAFNRYFQGTPLLIRCPKARSVRLTGNESVDELTSIANDIYRFFGKGPRAIKKLYVPEGYDFEPLVKTLHTVSQPIAQHNQFLNHLEYQKAVHLMNKHFYMDAGTFLFIESPDPNPPTAVIHYEYYHSSTDEPETKEDLSALQFLANLS